jgi:hypothetical protein
VLIAAIREDALHSFSIRIPLAAAALALPIPTKENGNCLARTAHACSLPLGSARRITRNLPGRKLLAEAFLVEDKTLILFEAVHQHRAV